jgi:transposase
MGTFFSLLTRFNHTGANAFVHQRTKQQQQSDRTIINKTDTKDTPICLDIVFGEQRKSLNIPVEKNSIIINSSNQLQFKTLILTFMNSGFLKAKEASEILGLSERHVRELNNALQRDDITSLIDKRQGQQKDYVFTEDIKAELIQQYSANIMTGRSTSSREITKQLNEACNCNVSDRAVRQYILKLGLNKIKGTLPNLLDELKKNSTI